MNWTGACSRISRVSFCPAEGALELTAPEMAAKTINVSSDDNPGETSEEILELANGCLCCSIKDSGIASIEKLMQRKGAFDHILLETTGLADPGKCHI